MKESGIIRKGSEREREEKREIENNKKKKT